MSEDWYYTVGGQQAGPVSWVELRRLVEQNKLAAADLVWNESLTAWTEAGKVEGLIVKPAVRMPPPLPKTATPPGLPDPAQTSRVFGEVVMAGSGGSSIGSDTNTIDVFLDDKQIGSGSVETGIRLTFETTVGDHTFRLSMSGVSAGLGFISVGLRKVTDALGARLNSRFPVGFTSPGHYRVTFKPKSGLFSGVQLPTEIEVVNR